jgi:hypothetical protein
MRFSLRLALLLVAYLSLTLAAFVAPSNFLTLLLWGVVLMALCYSLIGTITFRERHRSIAIGFAVACLILLGVVYTRPWRTPWSFYFIGNAEPPVHRSIEQYLMEYNRHIRLTANATPNFYLARIEDELRRESANAVGIMAAGLIGCVLGALAHRYRNDGAQREVIRSLP